MPYETVDYHRMWLDAVADLGRLQTEMEDQRKIIAQLYYSSHWDSDRLEHDMACLAWQKVKEAFDLYEPSPARISINDPQIGD